MSKFSPIKPLEKNKRICYNEEVKVIRERTTISSNNSHTRINGEIRYPEGRVIGSNSLALCQAKRHKI